MRTQIQFGRVTRIVAFFVVLQLAHFVAPAADYEWNFASGNLDAALGNGIMSYADAATPGLTSFGLTDGTTVPHIGGLAARYLHVPAFVDTANGYLLELVDTPANGGGGYVNQYTILFDVFSPGAADWTPFFNSAPDNSNDADWYVASDSSLGIGALGYSAAGVFSQEVWHRIAFAADLGAGNVSFYLDGVSVHDRTGGSLLDGRFSLYSNADAGPDLLLFNEGDGSGVYTHELYVSSVAFVDRALSPVELQALGGAQANGILVPEPTAGALLLVGAMFLGGWRRFRRSR